MEREFIGIIGLVILFILLIARAPVGLAMLVVGIGGNFVLSTTEPHLRFIPYIRQFKTLLWHTVANYDLSVVPLFILMGFLSANSGLSHNLFRGIYALVGRWRGGIAMAAIGACAGFGAVCGSSLATASTMGKIALPELRRTQCAPGFAAGALAAGGTLGILIPPSVVLVIYAVVVETSIVRMFQAALLPGLLAVLIFILLIAIMAYWCPSLVGRTVTMPDDERRHAIWRALPVVIIFGLIILGLGAGLFTPTPAAAIGVFAVMGYGWAERATGNGLTLTKLRDSILDTAKMTAMIYFILFGAEVLKGFFSRAGLPAAISWASTASVDPWLLLLLILFILIFLGCFMDSLSMIVVIVPFLWPVLAAINGGSDIAAENAAYGLDIDSLKIWFGILCLVVVELGLITPPVGLNVFIIASIAKDIPMRAIFRGVMPFFGVELVRIGLLIAFPALSLALPAWLSG